MNPNYKPILFGILFILVNCFFTEAQIKKERIKLGFASGTGSQNKYPFNLKDYSHDVVFYKAQINYKLKQKRKWDFELHFEPSIFVSEHQLLNYYFVKPEDAENFEELRDLYLQKRTITEYVLNCGFIVRYKIYGPTSVFAIGSVGPMIVNKPTERLASGFGFSDVFGLGVSYQINKIQLDFRYSVRHTSNLELKTPNSGHNTTNMEIGMLFQL